MGGDGQSAGLGNDVVGRQDVTGSAHLGFTQVQRLKRHIQVEQDMLQRTGGGIRVKERQDMKAKRSRQFETGQDHDLAQQATIFGELLLFLRAQTPTFLPTLQIGYFLSHRRVAGNGIMVGEGDHGQAFGLRLFQYFDKAGTGLLIVIRCRRVDV
jgi:hypothetical protein